jgi:hypothetical protein
MPPSIRNPARFRLRLHHLSKLKILNAVKDLG